MSYSSGLADLNDSSSITISISVNIPADCEFSQQRNLHIAIASIKWASRALLNSISFLHALGNAVISPRGSKVAFEASRPS